MTYEINASDATTEDLFLAYKAQQLVVRESIGWLWQAGRATIARYDALGMQLAGGDLLPLVSYHTAKTSQLAGAEQALYEKIVELMTMIEGVETAVPGLFPGVVVGVIKNGATADVSSSDDTGEPANEEDVP
jgi:hypothetical protein